MRLLIVIGLMIGLTGCSTTMKQTNYAPDGITKVSETEQPGSVFGPSPYDVGYAGGYKAQQDSKAYRVAAVFASPSPDDPIARAYADALKVMAAVMIGQERFEMKEPKTGFDVLYKLTDSVVPVAGFGALWQLGKAGIDAAGSAFGDNANLNNSLNRTNSAATAVGANPAVSSTASGTMPPAEPIIVEPFIFEAGADPVVP